MKILLPAILVLAAAAFVLFMPSASAEDESSVTVGDFQYILKDGEAIVVNYEPETVAKDLDIPATITYQDVNYNVVGLKSYCIFESGVETVTIPEFVRTYEQFSIVASTVTDIFVDPHNAHFMSDDGVLYDFNGSVLLDYPRGKEDPSFSARDSTVVIDAYSFIYNSYITSVTLPDSVYCINDSAFEGCTALAHVNSYSADDSLPSMLMLLGEYAFSECSALESVKLNEVLNTISSNAFRNTGLHTVSIPDSIHSISSGAFSSCTNLTAFESTNEDYPVKDGVLYELHNKELSLLCYPAARVGDSFTIPSNVGYVSESAFADCVNLKEVVLPSGMSVISYFAFDSCKSLERAVIPDSVVAIEMFAFNDCVNLKDVVLPAKLASIGQYAFNNVAITSLTIPASVSYIGYFAFSTCPQLRSVVIEEGELDIDGYAFFGCTALETIEFFGKDVTFEDRALMVGAESSPAEITVIVPKGMSIPDSAAGEFTTLDVKVRGERPYPYENFIGVFICILVLFAIVLAVREV